MGTVHQDTAASVHKWNIGRVSRLTMGYTAFENEEEAIAPQANDAPQAHNPPPAYGVPVGPAQNVTNFDLPAAQPGYVPGKMAAPATTVIIHQPATYGKFPQQMNCVFCRQHIITSTETECGTGSWLIGLVTLCLGGGCFCFLLPLCCDDCRDTVHTCPNCNRPLGRRPVFSSL